MSGQHCATPEHWRKVARQAAFALFSQTIVQALAIFYSIVGVVLFVPMIAGLYHRRAQAIHALTAVFLGVTTFLIARFTIATPVLGFLTPNLLGLLAAGAGYGGAVLVRR